MEIVSKGLIAAIALLRGYILWLEMFAWTTQAKKVFRSIQGLYNGFLAAGLLWSLAISDPIWSKNVALFFLICVFVAGIYGAATASKRIFYVQSVPAIIGILSIILI